MSSSSESSIVMISSTSMKSAESAESKTVACEFSYMLNSQTAVKNLVNKTVNSFSKKLCMKKVDFFSQIQQVQFQSLDSQTKKKEIKQTEKTVNLTSLIEMLNETTENIDKTISVQQVLKINKMNLI